MSRLQRALRRVVLLTLLLAGAHPAPATAAPSARVAGLVARMSPEEAVSMVHGVFGACPPRGRRCVGKAWYLPGVPRLGIPPLRFVDGPAGLQLGVPATAMPAAISLAATFDPAAATAFGAVLGREALAAGQQVVLAPEADLATVPVAGRAFEGLGEDPFLAGRLAAAEVDGIQGEGAIATVKHFGAYPFERRRRTVSLEADERTLMETALAPMEAAVRAGAGSVMCAYPRLNGVFSCSHRGLLRGVLKERWRFPGFVRSDRGALHELEDLLAGVDFEAPSGRVFAAPALLAALTGGTAQAPAAAWQAALEEAVGRILGQMERFGMLGPARATRTGLTQLRRPHARTAERLAAEGATLLRNRRGTLPLAGGARILVTGPAAHVPVTGGRGSSAVVPHPGTRSPVAALRARGTRVRSLPGVDLDGAVVPETALFSGVDSVDPGGHGLLRRRTTAGAVDPGAVPEPLPGVPPDVVRTVDSTGAQALPAGSAWRWTGSLVAPASGRTALKVQVAGQARVSLLVDGARRLTIGRFPATGVDGLAPSARTRGPERLQQATTTLGLVAGQAHAVDLRAVAKPGRPLSVRLSWVPPGRPRLDVRQTAAAARAADAAVVFAHDEAREGADRSLRLPRGQDALIDAVARANPRTVVVLDTAGPVAMPWRNRVAAILQMWYPGQRGGEATAALLLGRASPGGRLPVTFPTAWRRQPAGAPDGSGYPGVLRPGLPYPTAAYAEGVFTGYRWYERQRVRPLFPFGHGLTYTTFAFRDLVARSRGRGIAATFSVVNTGRRRGTAVPQIYVGRPRGTRVPLPRKALAGFRRVALRPGQTRRVTVTLPERALSVWSTADGAWRRMPGTRRVSVGASSQDIRASTRVVVRPAAAARARPRRR